MMILLCQKARVCSMKTGAVLRGPSHQLEGLLLDKSGTM